MWTKISATAVPAVERFDWFTDIISSSLMPTALSSERSADFQADAAVLDLGAAQVSSFEYSHVRSRRTPALIRRGDPEQYHLALLTRGRMWMSQCGSDAELFAGDMILWDTSHPFEADCHPGEGTLRSSSSRGPRCPCAPAGPTGCSAGVSPPTAVWRPSWQGSSPRSQNTAPPAGRRSCAGSAAW
ncbi:MULTISPECIES: hypothetical protein [unclassified Streptomyces]|uniref:AraC-like ligand-binding domain-containing protein n=1 Tax=unclassified Streptomyces TaxID=2593676 RepID=UPI000A43F263|nr:MULTISPECIES: hypothetical protein [unclassified Streptomyces]